MEIGQQAADHSEFEARKDEQIRGAFAGDDPAAVRARHRFQRPRRRRADRDHATAGVERAVDRGRRRLADLVALRLQPMILDALGPNRLKGAVADVERDPRHLHPAIAERLDQRTG